MGIIEAVRQIAKEEAKEEVKEEARKEEQEKSVKIFLTNTDFSVGKIADLIGVSASFVEGIKEELQSK